MDITVIFRNLVTNQFMPNFNYSKTEFSFRTVFYRSSHSYCCCNCAFDHELLNYISDTGELNEIKYNRVVENIANGECPHVKDAPEEFVTMTGIFGIHIAAAVGTVPAIKLCPVRSFITTGRIFQLEPYWLSVIKYRDSNRPFIFLMPSLWYFDKLRQIPTVDHTPLTNFYRTNRSARSRYTYDNGSDLEIFKIKIQEMSLIEFCIRKGKVSVINLILYKMRTNKSLHREARLPMCYDTRVSLCRDAIVSAEIAIVLNKPDILSHILTKLTSGIKSLISWRNLLHMTCTTLQRNECGKVLTQHGMAEPVFTPSTTDLIRIFNNFFHYADDYSLEKIKNLIPKMPVLNGKIDRSLCTLLMKSGRQAGRVLLSFAIDVDTHDLNGMSIFERILWQNDNINNITFRKTIEALIYENPETERHTSCVCIAICKDNEIFANPESDATVPGEYIMDKLEHSYYGHDDKSDYAFNFFAPMFIECGFPVITDELLTGLELLLHPAEKYYLKFRVENLRSLKWLCRAVLRKHFKGRGIHAFVDMTDIPKTIKDYILLGPILLSCRALYEKDEFAFPNEGTRVTEEGIDQIQRNEQETDAGRTEIPTGQKTKCTLQ